MPLGERSRGQLTSLPERQRIIDWIYQAVQDGARRRSACQELSISFRTLQRWILGGEVREDARPTATRPPPRHKLTDEGQQQILGICNDPKYASLPPSQIVPRLADEGLYVASESIFYRALQAHDQQHERGRAQKRSKSRPPATHVASGPNEVWVWDISYLPSTTRGMFYCLYCVEDLNSRKTVAWEVNVVNLRQH